MKKVISLVVILATVFACSVSAVAAQTGKHDGEYSYVTVDGENYFGEVNSASGVDKYISATQEGDVFFKTNKEITSLQADPNYFIPYGFVKSGDTYIKKDAEGNFANVPANQKFKQYKLPDAITTFGVSHSENAEDKEPIFGSYAVNLSEGAKYGTMLMVGDWDAFYLHFKNTYKDDAELINAISAFYEQHISGHTYVGLQWTDDSSATKVLKLYKTPQNNYMWKNNNHIQYAVKTKGLSESDQCTAVAYYTEDGKTVFSGEFKIGALK